MDALEFVKQLRRMDKETYRKYSVFDDSPEDVVAEVEEWAKMNPVKTRQSVFLERYPEAKIDNTGVLDVCPTLIVYSHRTDEGECIDINRKCFDCRREFWMQEVE